MTLSVSMNIDSQYISPEAERYIKTQLSKIESDENVRILFAIESGSRAWGFPSPDSDYDVRFVYVRPVDWYLTIMPGRDVIELPIEGDWDINGWDIKKALGLIQKPNPVLLEWLSSPIKYLWNEQACSKLIEFSQKITHGSACLHHYLSLGQQQWNAYIDGKSDINLKKYFYVVRPAMVIRWLRMNPDVIPPMDFESLREGIELEKSLNVELEGLLEKKSKTKELGDAPRITTVDEFIQQEFSWAREFAKSIKKDRFELALDADELFREIIRIGDK